jgi:hypothetical protein
MVKLHTVYLQYQYREQVWPRGWDWGDREERKAVRDYLKKVWKENNNTHPVETTLDNIRREKDSILNVRCQLALAGHRL